MDDAKDFPGGPHYQNMPNRPIAGVVGADQNPDQLDGEDLPGPYETRRKANFLEERARKSNRVSYMAEVQIRTLDVFRPISLGGVNITRITIPPARRGNRVGQSLWF